MNTRHCIALAGLAVLMAGCAKSDPGPLAGTWRADGIGMTTTFRSGEMETAGKIEKATYKVDGSSVVVTLEAGPTKGLSARYQIVSPGVATYAALTLRKVQ